MRIVSLELRGAIGIKKGLGKEEIFLDFSCFREGIIALVGENGSGKTTIIENLHPFRSLVSREGNLSDHFYLKDSFRILTFYYNNKEYRSEIYIDGITKKQEAYLKLDGLSLNDGKPTSYDEVLEEVIGSQELFFSSVFSAQKSLGISKLSASQKRQLFYELLGLNKYELYLEKAKEFLNQSEVQRQKILYEKSKSEEALGMLLPYENELSILSQKMIKLQNDINAVDIELNQLQERKKESEKLSFSFEEKVKSNQKSLQRIAKLEMEIEEKRNFYQSKIESIKSESLSKPINSNDSSALERQAEELRRKINELRTNDSIESLKNDLKKLKEEKGQLEKEILVFNEILTKEEALKAQLKRRNELSQLLEQYNLEELSLTKALLEEEKKEKEEKENLKPFYEELLSLSNTLSDKISKLELLKIERENFLNNNLKKIKSMEEEIVLLDQVPCDEKLGSSCPLLKKILLSKSEIQRTKEEFREKENFYEQLYHKLLQEKESYGARLDELNRKIRTKELEISKAHFFRLGQINAQKDKLNIIKSSCQYELKSINLTLDLEELNHAKTEIRMAEEKVKNLELLSISKEELIEEALKNEKRELEFLEERLKNIESKISMEKEKYEDEKLKQERELKNKIMMIQKESDYKIEELMNVIALEKSNLELSVEEKLKGVLMEIESLDQKLDKALKYKDQLNNENSEVKGRVIFLRSETEKLKEVKKFYDTIIMKLREVEKDIVEYQVLIRAFDKTGIPVLKLENSGIQITSLANELLKNFKNDFRIAFETTRLTKDKKRIKEVFDINVIDQDGICELKNKSGGEQVWIEASIQLALGILLRLQGKSLETSFLDEQDGALDEENALSYRTMIEMAHKKAGLFNTIIISHRSELINLIEQKIILDEEKIYLKAS